VATFVLVHGAWGAASHWEKVVPLLEAEGHRVVTVDWPGHGADPAPISGLTLEACARKVAAAVEAADEPVVLVGHSMGGMVVTQAAEYAHDRIEKLVYVAAFLPADGQSLPDLAGTFEGADNVQPQLLVDEAEGTCWLPHDAAIELFWAECSDDDAQRAADELGVESLTAMVTPVQITEEGAGALPRAYIECLRDQAITIDLQRYMHSVRPCDPVLQIDTDHGAMLSRPEELAAHLLSLA
jgi:pimeloyl-ACP methyl ester carboxylesterase